MRNISRSLIQLPPVKPNPYCRIELRNAENLLLALSWDKPPEEGRAAVPVWLERQGETVAVTVDAETLRRVAEDLQRLGNSVQSP